MSAFTISNNCILRNYYGNNRAYASQANRAEAKTSTLNYADSIALRRSVKKLDSFDFKDSSTNDLTKNIKAFVDIYNNTLESGKSSTNTSINGVAKSMRDLTKKYENELENLGITADANGYLKMSTSATTNINGERFGELLGSGSKYMSQLSEYAKRIARHVDYYI